MVTAYVFMLWKLYWGAWLYKTQPHRDAIVSIYMYVRVKIVPNDCKYISGNTLLDTFIFSWDIFFMYNSIVLI